MNPGCCFFLKYERRSTCIGWQMRLSVGVSPGLEVSGRRLSSRPSSIPLSLPVLSAGPQLKNEWELWWRRRRTRRNMEKRHQLEQLRRQGHEPSVLSK